MTEEEKARRKERRATAMKMWMAKRSSRNKSFIDRICRRMLEKAMAVSPEHDFMRDPIVDNDQGFDPDELDRYQRGETA